MRLQCYSRAGQPGRSNCLSVSGRGYIKHSAIYVEMRIGEFLSRHRLVTDDVRDCCARHDHRFPRCPASPHCGVSIAYYRNLVRSRDRV
jgi:hypothetical protein